MTTTNRAAELTAVLLPAVGGVHLDKVLKNLYSDVAEALAAACRRVPFYAARWGNWRRVVLVAASASCRSG